MRHIAEDTTYYLLYGVLYLLALLPWAILYLLSDILYYIVYYIIRYRRKVVRANLEMAYPLKTEQQRRDIERHFYRFLADYVVETIKLLHISDAETKRRMRFENAELIDRLTSEGRSVILLLGHYGNWEWIPSLTMWCDNSRFAGGQIYRPLRNRCFDRLFLHLRTRFGTECIAKKDTLRVLLQHKRSGKPFVTGFMADQTPSPSNIHHWTMFMGMPTPVLTGYETLARKLDAAVVYIDVEILSRGYYKAVFKLMEEHPANNTVGFPVADRYMAAMEHTISRSPHAWLWTHKRWKHSHLFVNSTI